MKIDLDRKRFELRLFRGSRGLILLALVVGIQSRQVWTVQINLARISNAADLDLKLAVQDEVVGDGIVVALVIDVLNETEANLLHEREAVACSGRSARQLSISVDRLITRRPNVNVDVMLVQQQLNVNALDALLLLLE